MQWAPPQTRQRLRAEFQKTVITDLVRTQPDAVIFDFIDERFNLLSCGQSFVTGSDDLWQARGLEEQGTAFACVSRQSDGLMGLWKAAALAVASQIREALPAVRFVVHRAFLATEFVRESETREFGGALRHESARMNRWLAEAILF